MTMRIANITIIPRYLRFIEVCHSAAACQNEFSVAANLWGAGVDGAARRSVTGCPSPIPVPAVALEPEFH
jgi:hypothetical protein